MIENLNTCPSLLTVGHNTYSPLALRQLYGGKKVSHILNYDSFGTNNATDDLFIKMQTHISISGYQKKFSIKLNKNILELTDKGGQYILKPKSSGLKYVEQMPANENLSMQIASQVFGIETARNGLIFFKDGEVAYITKRFDVLPNGTKALKEDFASLLNKTELSDGNEFKINSSYLEMANLIDRNIPAALLNKERLFSLAIFNYLISNGDAHLKNFAIMDYLQNGLYQLSPAYDLLCTRLHINDSDIALQDRLYEGDVDHPSFSKYGIYMYDDFFTLGEKMGLRTKRVEYYLNHFTTKKEQVEDLVSLSFLNDEMKKKYLDCYYDKLKRLQTSYKKEYASQ